jgi:lysophospholipase L1-like esterase
MRGRRVKVTKYTPASDLTMPCSTAMLLNQPDGQVRELVYAPPAANGIVGNMSMLYQNVSLHNVAEIAPAPDQNGYRISRVPLALKTHLNETAQSRILRGACSELRFNLRDASATVILQMEDEPGLVEVWNGPFFGSWHIVDTTPTPINVSMPERLPYAHQASLKQRFAFDPLLFRIVLPWNRIPRLHDIIGEVEPPQVGQTPEQRYLAYGSSITNGSASTRPTGMYAMRTAARLGVDLLNIGLGGGAHCEPALADYLASRDDWDFATLELGINMVTWASVEDFGIRAAYFVNKLASEHPDKWIFCLDMFPFWQDFDEDTDQPARFRHVVREIVRQSEHPKVVHIEAQDLLTDLSGLTSDMLHPAPTGMEEIARNLAPIIQQHLDSDNSD